MTAFRNWGALAFATQLELHGMHEVRVCRVLGVKMVSSVTVP